MQLFDLFKPPTHQRPPPNGENGAGLGLLEGQLGGGQYLLGAGQLLGLTRQLRAVECVNNLQQQVLWRTYSKA